MRFFISALASVALLGLAGCSSDTAEKGPEVRTVPAGEKAGIGHLTYSVVDSQILTKLGDDMTPRVPHDRFLILQLAVTNSSNVDNPIPAVELVGDSGTVYNELPDGTGVNNWMGIVRHVGPGQTERGAVVFDAPAAHYRLRFSDEAANLQIMSDFPLSYAHEKTEETMVPTTDLSAVGASGSQTFKPAPQTFPTK